jgi:hypothetical protein
MINISLIICTIVINILLGNARFRWSDIAHIRINIT